MGRSPADCVQPIDPYCPHVRERTHQSGVTAILRETPQPGRGSLTWRVGEVVGGPGFEPGASRSRTVRAAGLRQPPHN